MPIFLLHTLPSIRSDKIQAESLSPHPFTVFVNRLDICGLLGQAYSGECLDLICGFESQRYTVFCCLAFFYAGRGSNNTEIFAFDFEKSNSRVTSSGATSFSWIIA